MRITDKKTITEKKYYHRSEILEIIHPNIMVAGDADVTELMALE